jgi:hypothetical protein
MVDVAAIQTFHQELSWESKVFAGSECFLVYIFSGKVLRDTTVVGVTQLCFVMSVVKQVINVHVVYIPLDFFHIHFVFLGFCLLFVTLFTTAIRIIIGFFQPRVC